MPSIIRLITLSKMLWVALAAMFFQQCFTILSQSVIPLIAPLALPAMDAPASYLGIFVSIAAVVKTIVNVGCGNFIRRYGGIRVSQASLLFVIVALLFASSGIIWMFLITAICIACGTAAGTPASSHILSRYAPPRYAPLVYSAKQTSVPVSLAFGGLAIPFLAAHFGWQGTLIVIAVACFCFGMILQTIRGELDRDRNPNQELSVRDIKSTVMVVVENQGLRRMAIVIFAFVGLQVCYMTYMVLFLTNELGFSYVEAGGLYATAMTVAIPARIFWGYVASSWISPGHLLGVLAVTMAAAMVATGLNSPNWAPWQILAVAIVVTSTALSWQGVLLSEVARLAPEGQVGAATGGVLGAGSIGQTVMPLGFSGILAFTGDYHLGFMLVAIPSFLVGVMLFVGGVEGKATPTNATP